MTRLGTYKINRAFAGMCPGKPLEGHLVSCWLAKSIHSWSRDQMTVKKMETSGSKMGGMDQRLKRQKA